MTLGRTADPGREARRRTPGGATGGARALVAGSFALAIATTTTGASALQPLSAFLSHADANNTLRVANADAIEKDAEADVALGHLFPALSARGVYTRNQNAVDFNIVDLLGPTLAKEVPPQLTKQPIVILPANQLDAFFQLDVPIFDPGNYGRYRVARAIAAAAKVSTAAAKLEVERQIVRTYYQILGAVALVEAAKKSADVAAKNFQLVKDRRSGGIASDLDAARASADVQRAAQDVANAELLLASSIRALETLTALTPTATNTALPPDDWHDEAPLASWMANGVDAPSVRAAEANLHAAEVAHDSTKLAFVPSISGSAVEHLTNGPGFTGSNSFWNASLTAAWRFDYSLVAGLKQANANLASARARRDGEQRNADDAIYNAWLQVRANIAKSRAARAQADAANQAVGFANDRYLGGIATQLDVVTAQRDAFQAEVGRVSADADLAASRILLRLAAGKLSGAERRSP
jgi:outer membrane protein TolC